MSEEDETRVTLDAFEHPMMAGDVFVDFDSYGCPLCIIRSFTKTGMVRLAILVRYKAPTNPIRHSNVNYTNKTLKLDDDLLFKLYGHEITEQVRIVKGKILDGIYDN